MFCCRAKFVGIADVYPEGYKSLAEYISGVCRELPRLPHQGIMETEFILARRSISKQNKSCTSRRYYMSNTMRQRHGRSVECNIMSEQYQGVDDCRQRVAS